MLYMVTFTINIHQYTPNVSIYTIHGSYGLYNTNNIDSMSNLLSLKFDPSPNKARMTQATDLPKMTWGVQSWGYPNSWMVYNGKSPSQMDDNGYGTPMNWNPPLYKIYQNINEPTNSSNHLIQAALAEFKSLNGMAMNVSMASSKGKQWTGDE